MVTGLGLWSTVVWSARLILSESIFNFSLVIVMGMLLLEVFIIICASFRSILNEFDALFYFMEVILFATMPLLCTVIITWFACVEMPSLDLPLCFSTTYFLYTMYLGKPRRSSHPAALNNSRIGLTGEPALALPRKVLLVVYGVPVVMSFFLHLALHHNVLLDHTWTRTAGLFISVLSPIMYDSVILPLSPPSLSHFFRLLVSPLITSHHLSSAPTSSRPFHSSHTFHTSLSTYTALTPIDSHAPTHRYMITCAEAQLDYWPVKTRPALTLNMGRAKLIGSTVVFLCMQDHPLMRDLKAFSGQDEPMATVSICGAVVLAAMAVHTHRMNTVKMFNDLPEDEMAYRKAKVRG